MHYTGTAGALGAAFLVAMAAAHAQPLANANHEESSDVRVEITELKRTGGDTVTLKAVFVNGTRKTFSPPHVSQIYLLNTASRTKHTVAKDERGRWVASQNSNINAGAKREVWAKYAAPPAGVKTLTVVVPKFAPLEDVPLSE